MKKIRNYVHKNSQKINRPTVETDRKKEEKRRPPKIDWRYFAQ